MSTRPFRFLDLPAELRYMVYEAIEATTKKRELDVTDRSKTLADRSLIVMFRGAIQMSILATCRLVNQEASPIMARKTQTMTNEPVRFLMDWDVVVATQDILYSCFDTSPETLALHAREGNHPMALFIKSCRTYYVAAAITRTVDVSIANVEITITALAGHVNDPDMDRVLDSFGYLHLELGVILDMFMEKQPPAAAFLLRLQHIKDLSGLFEKDLSDAEWAEHVRKLGHF
ncbi:hypothetical protein G6011_01354 [Alternaria panax]|uniref:Uncharacterized protein n=1 Tax=Alternaria panax TaxID=48097 RepID=A0AAD4IK13_9PLEO|nr:hypothetical protein G6011_01354 [Alternaria panax]